MSGYQPQRQQQLLQQQQQQQRQQQQQYQQQRDEAEQSRSQDEDWKGITDQTERRKIQNRIAQRKFREKSKRQRDDEARIAENQNAAGSAYAAPDARDLAANSNPNGLPWGSVSMQYVVDAGRIREERSQYASREGSRDRREGTQG
ncbi:mediator complex subunit [Schaereria dolodes]|nr:mediator complex subunit [Schaereria dolodes]